MTIFATKIRNLALAGLFGLALATGIAAVQPGIGAAAPAMEEFAPQPEATSDDVKVKCIKWGGALHCQIIRR